MNAGVKVKHCGNCHKTGHNKRSCKEPNQHDIQMLEGVSACIIQLWWKKMRQKRMNLNSPSKKPKPKYKKHTIPKTKKIDVWCKYMGNPSKKCLVCGSKDISPFRFDVGHIIPEKQGGTLNLTNLRPICSSCNTSMGTQNLLEFTQKVYPQNLERIQKGIQQEIQTSPLFDNRCDGCKNLKLGTRNHLQISESKYCHICLTRINLKRCGYCEKNDLPVRRTNSYQMVAGEKLICESCGEISSSAVSA